MPKLRGHHLICLHFFQGEGYNAGFVKSLRSVIEKAEGSPVTIAHGIDDVCSKCPHMKNERCGYTEHSDDEISEMDKKALDLLQVKDDRDMIWHEIREIIPEIFRSWHESYCVACGWRKACEKNDSYRQLSHMLTP